MSLLCGGLTQAGGAPGVSGTGNTDGDTSGLKDTLEFGVALGSHPTTALLGGVKSVNADGSTAINTAGANSVSIQSSVDAATQVASGVGAIVVGSYGTSSGIGSIAIGGDSVAGNSGPTSSGNGAIAIGGDDGTSGAANAAAVNSIAIGSGSSITSSAENAIAIGKDTVIGGGSDDYSVAVGSNADAGIIACVAIGAFAVATNQSVAIGGNNAAGFAAEATGATCVAVGVGAVAGTSNSATAVGALSSAGGTGAIALGRSANASANNSTAIGEGMSNSIADTWVIRGANLTPQAASETDWDKLAGCQITMVSPEDDATATGNNRFDFPSGVSMFVDEIDVVVTELDGTVTTQPTTRAGSRNVADDAGNNEYFIAAALGTNLDTLRQRDRDTSMANDHAVTSLSGDITVAATLNTATVMGIRWVFKGYLLEDE